MKTNNNIQDVVNYKNPYPKDIFRWDNKEKLDFNRGRFNQHCYEIVENMRNDLLKQEEKNMKEEIIFENELDALEDIALSLRKIAKALNKDIEIIDITERVKHD